MKTPRRVGRRTVDTLSRERIIDTAIALLDEGGEPGLTFRALSERLETGAGAISWHVANKNGLLEAVTQRVIASVVTTSDANTAPETIREVALGIFDAIEAHPWLGAQLSREPWQPAVLRILEAFGGQLSGLGVPRALRFACAFALLNYVLGLAGQYAAGARVRAQGVNRVEFLEAATTRFMQTEDARYPFINDIAVELREHDDREQFLAGLEIILRGIDHAR